ncbi:MAG: hypothetical protein PWP46_1739 [Fusobacteriaceae bacterium]|jgi:uncharacterized protein YacL|nr:hypothetical protein [Fusobacteriales bacterium]MDN5304853.1 hypothetical protein [Fusobacteriaceae bacterium]
MNLKAFFITIISYIIFIYASFGFLNSKEGIILLGVLSIVLSYLIVHFVDYIKKTLEERKIEKGAKAKILDSSIIIDGRILDIMNSGFLEGDIVIPKFVLEELQTLSDSSDNMKRARGRRGLDLVKQLQEMKDYNIVIEEKDYPEKEVDAKLVKLAKDIDGDVLTTDFNLNKVATIQGVKVLNINQLTNSLKLVVLPNEELTIELIKKGDRDGQAVGYLQDGTMVVAEDGGDHVGEIVTLVITSVYPTAAGRMIFGRIKQ